MDEKALVLYKEELVVEKMPCLGMDDGVLEAIALEWLVDSIL